MTIYDDGKIKMILEDNKIHPYLNGEPLSASAPWNMSLQDYLFEICPDAYYVLKERVMKKSKLYEASK